MCGRFTLTIENFELIMSSLEVSTSDIESSWKPRWNIAPTQEHLILHSISGGEDRQLSRSKWGLISDRDRNRSTTGVQINARAESLEVLSTYQEMFQKGRCLIPADGFYEWSRGTGSRRPFWFHRPDYRMLLFAGLFTKLKSTSQSLPATTFAIITTQANGPISRIHDRMPAIINDHDADDWLALGQSAERLRDLLQPASPDTLQARAVSRRVNAITAEGPDCLAEVEEETQGVLF